MAKKGKYLQPKTKKPLGWKKPVLILFAVILVIACGVAGFGAIYYNYLLGYVQRAERQEQELSDEELEAILGFVPETIPEAETTAPMETADAPTTAAKPAEDPIVNIMIVGQQMREYEEAKLSDTMLLCTVNKETKTLTLTSFLRDTYVKLPNYKNHVCGMQRINVAYNLGWRWAGDLGGMEMLDMLILENFGVEVDYNVEIDFNSFVQIVDHLGGVTVELNQDEVNYLNGADFSTKVHVGSNTLPGDIALEYVRIRKSNGSDSDIHRTARQRNFVTQIINQVRSLSISELDKLIKEILPMVLTDMEDSDITRLMVELLPLLLELKIESNQIPAEGTYHGEWVQIGGMDAAVLKCDVGANRKLLMEICEPNMDPEE